MRFDSAPPPGARPPLLSAPLVGRRASHRRIPRKSVSHRKASRRAASRADAGAARLDAGDHLPDAACGTPGETARLARPGGRQWAPGSDRHAPSRRHPSCAPLGARRDRLPGSRGRPRSRHQLAAAGGTLSARGRRAAARRDGRKPGGNGQTGPAWRPLGAPGSDRRSRRCRPRSLRRLSRGQPHCPPAPGARHQRCRTGGRLAHGRPWPAAAWPPPTASVLQ